MNMIPFHPLADVFPLIEGAEFEALVESIKVGGLREPIVILNSQILDGRNRYRACIEAAVEPVTVSFEGDDPIEFVLAMNLTRRHLDTSQRALVAGALCNLASGQRADLQHKNQAGEIMPASFSTEMAAQRFNINRHTISAARKVLAEGTEAEVKAVRDGKAAVSTIARGLREKLAPEQRAQRRDPTEKSRSESVETRLETQRMNAQIYNQTRDAVDFLTGLPAPLEVARIIRANSNLSKRVGPKIPLALKWLKEFSDAWNEHGA